MVYDHPLGSFTPFGYVYSFHKPNEYLAYTKINAIHYNIPSLRLYDDSSDNIYPGDYLKSIFYWFNSYKSIIRVCENLNNLGIPIPKVAQSHIKEYISKRANNEILGDFIIVLKPGDWSRSTVRDILLNSFYTGVRAWNRFENRTNRERDSSSWILLMILMNHLSINQLTSPLPLFTKK